MNTLTSCDCFTCVIMYGFYLCFALFCQSHQTGDFVCHFSDAIMSLATLTALRRAFLKGSLHLYVSA